MDLEDVFTGDQFRALNDHYSIKQPTIRLWTQDEVYVVGQLRRELTSNAVAAIDIKDDTGQWGVLQASEFKDMFTNLSAGKARS
ncbi:MULTISPECIES: hypothetical protein [Burkholderia]|uniref:Uncharacterized protein n=1 Tax=Burkholderia paludis TaxID=1506587 RepID=A0A6J5DBX0_9BURK|nr:MULTISPECIES: hypothetical protein [Burkholderia]CAB3750877.1 hypothetical protein LMG30113_01317 [Burkholderia paludis]VWB09893.1 hypothetical protein BPA30113_00160 [Burkholderia paludis]